MEIPQIEIGGVTIVNATPHGVAFMSESGEVVTAPPCGITLAARPVEALAGTRHGAQLVRTVFEGTEAGLRDLAEIERLAPGAIIVGSIVSAQAYPGRVFGMVPVPGTERAAPAEKRFLPNRFTVFGDSGTHKPAGGCPPAGLCVPDGEAIMEEQAARAAAAAVEAARAAAVAASQAETAAADAPSPDAAAAAADEDAAWAARAAAAARFAAAS